MIEKTLLSSYVKDFVNWDTQISDTLAKFKSSIDLSRWIMSFLAYYDWSIHKWISEKDYQYIQALEFSWRVIFPEYKLIIEKNYQFRKEQIAKILNSEELREKFVEIDAKINVGLIEIKTTKTRYMSVALRFNKSESKF